MTESKAIFLSYASQDAEAARRICEALNAAGIEVWLDTTELRGGDSWDQKIRRQIKDCALFIPIISSHTQARTEGYFRFEWRLADQRTHLMGRNRAFLVPICIDDTRDADADVPDSFSAVQWIRLPGGESSSAFIERVALLLTPSPSANTASLSVAPSLNPAAAGEHKPPEFPSSTDIRPRSRPWWSKALLRLTLLVIALLAGGYWALHRQTPQAQSQSARIPPSAPVSSAYGAIPGKSVAVLPFADMSERKDQEYFSDGLTEEMIDLLSQLSDLRVPARTSSFYFKGKNEPIASIAQQLRVANLLEGSVRKAGKRLRITVQLIRAENGYHLWSQSYDRQDSDIFAVQDDIARAVVLALQGKLEGGATAADTSRGTTNAQAYTEYLRGRALRRQGTLEGDRRAIEAYERAIALDPKFAAAYAGLGLAEDNVNLTGEISGIERARNQAEQAIALAPDEARGYMARGFIRNSRLWDWAGAQADIEKGLTLDPRDSQVQNAFALVLDTVGRLPEAIAAEKQVTELDPLWADGWENLAIFFTEKGDYAAAEAAVRRALELEPTSKYALESLGMLRLLQGRNQEALETFRKIDHDSDYGLASMAMAEYSLGQMTESQQRLDELITKYAQTSTYQIAEVFAWRGETDQAFDWLEQAYGRRDTGLTALKSDPLLKSLRTDPRYKALLTKLKLPER